MSKMSTSKDGAATHPVSFIPVSAAAAAAPIKPMQRRIESLEVEALETSGSSKDATWTQSLTAVASGVTDVPFRVARHLVSGSKRRTQTDTFDLDLTYIVPRVIALGLPSSSFESWYRNPLSDVRSFMDGHHGGRYAMVNLCDERDYLDTDWPGAVRVMRYPFADHHAPALRALDAFCERAYAFMEGDQANVLAVHCKAGKGRTGVMVCAFLLRIGHAECPSADAAIHFFRSARTTDLDAINQPSQVRCVRMYEQLLRCVGIERRAQLLEGATVVLKAVTLSSAPGAYFASSGAPRADADALLNPWQLKLELHALATASPTADGIQTLRSPICTCGPVRCAPFQPAVRFELPGDGLLLRGDFELRLSNNGLLMEERLGWATLHTGFLARMLKPLPYGGALYKEDVDGAHKDARFPAAWRIELEYALSGEESQGGVQGGVAGAAVTPVDVVRDNAPGLW